MALVLSQTGKVKNNHLPDGTICPTIERGNGIHYKIPYIDTSWRRWGFPLLDNYYFYEQGVGSKITWFDYSGNCNELTPASNYYPLGNFNNHYSLLFSGNATSEDYESTTWKTLYNELLENISWLWGNVEEGGTFIYKCSSNPSSTDGLGYVLCMWWGIYTKTETVNNVETTYYKIAISHYSGSQRTLNQLKQVGWCVYNNTYYRDGEDVENNYDYLSAFLSGNNSTWKAGNNDIGITATDNQTATSRNDYYTVFGIGDDVDIDVPVLIWTPTNTTDNVLISLQDWRPEAPWVQISGVPEDGYDLNPTGGIDVTGGGYGTPDEEGDDIDDESLGDLNSLTAINTGLVTLFRPTQTELQNFSSFLYTGITDSIADQLKKLIANPLDYLVFVALCKFAPPVSGVREEISFAGVGSGVYADKISNQFYDLDCGSIQFGEQYNSFLDYSPNSKLKLYLPFCSCVDLNIDDCVGSTISVRYRIDLLSGACVAKVKITRNRRSTAPKDCSINSIVYDFTGNVYLTMPISATDWRGTYQSLISLAGGVLTGATIGGAGGGVAIAESVASAITSQKVSVSRSGQIGANFGYLGENKPYLILERPIESIPRDFEYWQGLNSNIIESVGNLSGYTEIEPESLWTDKFTKATKKELDRLKEIVNGGIYL